MLCTLEKKGGKKSPRNWHPMLTNKALINRGKVFVGFYLETRVKRAKASIVEQLANGDLLHTFWGPCETFSAIKNYTLISLRKVAKLNKRYFLSFPHW